VVLTPDIVVQPDWLENLAKGMFADRTVGIGGGKAHYPDGCTLRHAGGFVRPPRAVGDHYGRGEMDNGQYDSQRRVDYVMRAALGVKRSTLRQIGWFDEGYLLDYAEIDLCFRAHRAGYKVSYVPDAVLICMEGNASGRRSTAHFRRFHADRLRFLLKHYSLARLLCNTFPAEYKALGSHLCHDERRRLSMAYTETLRDLSDILNIRVKDGADPMSSRSQEDIAKALSDLQRSVRKTTDQVEATVLEETYAKDEDTQSDSKTFQSHWQGQSATPEAATQPPAA
jgi:GT2 family glycosyltransferase